MDDLTRWREAEARLGEPAPELPERLQVLLRALDALDRGSVESIDALLPGAPPDVAALLTLLRAPPDAPPPDWSQVPETFELPLQDLLALLDRARTGASAAPTARLDVASRYRPVLHALVRLCTDTRTDVYSNPVLAAFSRRVDQLQMVTRATQITGSVARTRLGVRVDALRLDPDRWPEITAERVQGDLRFWATTRIPWDDWHDGAVTRLLHEGEAHEGVAPSRREALGLLLDRLGRDLRAGRVTGSARPARAAFSLAWALDPASPLVTQLALLQLRTDRYDPEHPGRSPLLLLHLWRHRQHLSLPEQALAARALLQDGLGEATPDDVRAAALTAMSHDPDPDRAAEVLLQHAIGWRPDPLLRGVADAPTPRRVQLAGMHAAAHRAWDPALAAIRRLARESPACVPSMLRVLQPGATEEGLQATWDALLTSAVPLGAWGPVLARDGLRAALRPDHLAGLRALPASTPSDHAARVLLAHPDVRAAVLDLGRHLRTLPAADDAAIEVLGWWLTWDPASPLPAGGGRPVAAMLLRQGGGPARAAGERVPRGAPWAPGAVAWWLSTGDPAADAPAWRDHLADLLVAPEGMAEALRDATHAADLRAARTIAEAARAAHAALHARLGG